MLLRIASGIFFSVFGYKSISFYCVLHNESNRDLVDRTGVTFRIENINKEDEEVAHSTRLPSHYYLYYPNMNFLTKYADKLPIGDLLTWKTRKDLDVWMNRQIYFSHNIQQNYHISWFTMLLHNESVIGDPLFSAGHMDTTHMKGTSIWVLFKVGYQVHPIHVINNKLRDGWVDFWLKHKLELGFRLLIGAERKWVFNVTVLDKELNRVNYYWDTGNNKLSIPHAIPVSQTTMSPSIFQEQHFCLQFGHVYTTFKSFNQKLKSGFHCFLKSNNLQSICIQIGSNQQIMSIYNQQFHLHSLHLAAASGFTTRKLHLHCSSQPYTNLDISFQQRWNKACLRLVYPLIPQV